MGKEGAQPGPSRSSWSNRGDRPQREKYWAAQEMQRQWGVPSRVGASRKRETNGRPCGR